MIISYPSLLSICHRFFQQYSAGLPFYVTKNQLIRLGVDKFGKKIASSSKRKYGVYSYSYGINKQRKGIPVNTFNLYNTGKLHRSFVLKSQKTFALLQANTIKNGYDIRKKYRTQMQFSNESINSILHRQTEYNSESLVNYIRKELLKNLIRK